MSQSVKEDLLKELRQRVVDHVRSEKLRLSVERDFLESVLNKSLGGPTKKQDEEDKLQAIGNVRRFLGIKETRR